MEVLREILAKNLRESRRKLNLSQEKLAELANLSTHYVVMIENYRKFPSPEVLGRLAEALEISPHELFSVPPSPAETIERLHKEIIADIKQVIRETVATTIREQCSSAIKEKTCRSMPVKKGRKSTR